MGNNQEDKHLNIMYIAQHLYVQTMKHRLDEMQIEYTNNRQEFTFEVAYQEANKIFYSPTMNPFHRIYGSNPERIVFAADIEWFYNKKTERLSLSFDIRQTD